MTKARSNAVANAAKGDLTVGNGTDLSGILAVGSNGDTLVADSSTSTGLRYNANFAAGKNKIINGDFGVWQRGTSFVNPSVIYSADRWLAYADSTNTVSRQTFTPGTAPVAGYEGQYFLRIDKAAGGAFTTCSQRIEDVRTFAGQTVTVSFWAKASAAVTLTNGFTQNFGSGGSASVDSFPATVSVTTSWARYSYTLSIPSISGKTVGSSSYLAIDVGRALTSSAIVLDIWGVQVEAGSVATAFQTATGTIQGELAACQRYYAKSYSQGTAPQTNTQTANLQSVQSGNVANVNYFGSVEMPVIMRTAPTVTIYSYTSSTAARVSDGAGTDLAANSGTTNFIGDRSFNLFNQSGGTLTASTGGFVFHYVASAEL